MLSKKGRYLVFMLVITIMLLIFTGCGKKGEVTNDNQVSSGEVYQENGLPKDKKVTLQAAFPVTGYGKDYFDYAVKTFQERFPNVTINVQWFEEGGEIYKKHIDALLKSNANSEMYDWLYSLDNNIMMRLIETDKLEEQDDLWNRSLYDSPQQKIKDSISSERRAFEVNGHIYALPTSSVIYGLYYNKMMFKKNGWNEQIKNWDEFLLICEKIQAKGIAPLVMAGKYPYYFSYGWNTIPHAVGGEDFFNAQYQYAPDVYISEPYLMMLERMDSFVKKGYLHPGTLSFDHTQSQMEFVQGKAAFITNATWIANEMKDVTSPNFEWGFMAFPGNDPGQNQVVLVRNAQSGLIWKNKPLLQKKWTKEFNLWLLNLDVQLKFAQSGGVPIRKDFIAKEKELKGVSPSVIAALQVINTEGIRLVDDTIRERTIKNVEMAKLGKVVGDGYSAIIIGNKTVLQVANEINKQYMKSLRAEK